MSRPRRVAPPALAAAVRGYVDRVGTDIVSRTDRADLPYEFRVVNTDVVNAFAVPGGFIYMNRGQAVGLRLPGAGYLTRSGWDPHGLVRFFETLQEMRERRPNALERLPPPPEEYRVEEGAR